MKMGYIVLETSEGISRYLQCHATGAITTILRSNYNCGLPLDLAFVVICGALGGREAAVSRRASYTFDIEFRSTTLDIDCACDQDIPYYYFQSQQENGGNTVASREFLLPRNSD